MSNDQAPSARDALAKGGSKLWVDVGPAAIFMISYQIANRMAHDQAIFIATGVFMVATAAAAAWSILKDKRFPPMLAVTFVIVMLFGGLTTLSGRA